MDEDLVMKLEHLFDEHLNFPFSQEKQKKNNSNTSITININNKHINYYKYNFFLFCFLWLVELFVSIKINKRNKWKDYLDHSFVLQL